MTQNISNKAANSSSGSRAILIALTLSMIKSQTWIIKVQDAIQECVCHLTKSTVYSVDTIVCLRRKGGYSCLWGGNWLHWSCLMVKKRKGIDWSDVSDVRFESLNRHVPIGQQFNERALVTLRWWRWAHSRVVLNMFFMSRRLSPEEATSWLELQTITTLI